MSEAGPSTSDTSGPTGIRSGRDAEPEPIIEAVERVQQHDQVHRGAIPQMHLPGFGELEEYCGDDLLHFCEDCYRPVIFGQTCNRSRCPRCGANWVVKRCTGRGTDAKGIVCRLEALRKELHPLYDRHHDDHAKHHHLVLSPPGDWAPVAEDSLDRTKQVVREICEELGVQGHVFPHMWRGKDEYEEHQDRKRFLGADSAQAKLFDDEAHIAAGWTDLDEDAWEAQAEEIVDGDDRGKWRERLFSGRDWQGDVKDELKYSPHFHVIGVADFVKGQYLTKRVYEETGWIIHRITPPGDSNASLYNLEAMAGATAYALSHTAVYQTDAGNWQCADFPVGSDYWGVDVYDKTREEARAAVRQRAPRVLGIPLPKLECDAEVPVDLEAAREAGDVDQEDVDEPDAGARDGPPATGPPRPSAWKPAATHDLGQSATPSNGPQRASAGNTELPDEADGLDEADPPGGGTWSVPGTEMTRDDYEFEPRILGGDDDTVETETCSGRLLNAGYAERYLNADEFAERRECAPFVSELRERYELWKEREDWLG